MNLQSIYELGIARAAKEAKIRIEVEPLEFGNVPVEHSKNSARPVFG